MPTSKKLSEKKLKLKKRGYPKKKIEKYERCVKKVKRSSPKYNPYAVCHSSVLQKKKKY